ncbi:LOW QUALITY PROTEIN: A kinase (PRKA) anchor protein 1b [Brachyistius frenatus]|uniref:LOW QUALITY PROTEIN: A kinase (PRKA) anchor protein 1b n=1 Tax=Brachyistius frenatus TaxID=100188 RepID=UPI0037E81DC5
MPLRFRSFLPYTLPGVLALIGWWWYTSRKKERLIGLEGTEGTPAAADRNTSPAEASNSWVERGADTESPAHRPAKVSSQRTEQENISLAGDTDVAHSLRGNCEEDAAQLGRIEPEEAHEPSDWTLPSLGEEDSLQVSLHRDPERSSSPAPLTELDKYLVTEPACALEAAVEELVSPCHATKVTAPHLSDAERPEPEGEVARYHVTASTQEQAAVCALTPDDVHRGIPSEADSLDTPPSAHDFLQHTLTSTPATPPLTCTALTAAQVTPGEVQVHRSATEDRELELLAAGLISEVISAATQEVLGVTGCQDADGSAAPASGRLRTQQEPIRAQQHLLMSPSQVGCECNITKEKEEPGVPNGCSSVWEPVEVSHSLHQTNSAQRGHWATPPAGQSSPGLNMKLKGYEATALAEDSACSTCHSEDGVSSEDLLNSTYDGQMDAIQVTDLSAREATQPQSLGESVTEAAVLDVAEDNSAVCELKRLNGMGLRNGAHGTCEVETDQSGGSDVNSMDSVDSGCTMGAGENQSNHSASSGSELIVWEIEVPKHLVGRLIGKQGRYVSFLKQNSGAKIYISTLPYTQEFQICHIEGTQQQVDKALSLIGKKFKDLDLTNLYAPPPPLTLPSLPMTSWLLLPSGVTVEVIVVNIVSAGHVFVQQHTHPTYHALRSLDQQMFLCYSQPGTPALPSPAEVGVICAAPAVEGAWWRAQVITFYKDTSEVEIRYVDYGGYDRVKIDSLRQIRSDFVTLPFQGAEVLLDNIAPLPGEDRFSAEATSALEEMTRGVALLAQVSNYDNNTGLPLVHLWNMVGEEVASVNRTLAERGLGVWVDGF